VTLQSISKIDAKRIKETILKIANSGGLVLTDHVEQKMSERNFTIRDVINVLLNGRLKKKRGFDEEYQEWKYSIVGRDIDGTKLSIVFTINELERLLVLITGMRG
jgi:hypothetical protein